MNCPNCKCDFTHFTATRFKKTFKVGDVVTAWPTSKKVRISAIGESRLLYIDIGGTKERVASFNLPWRKIKTLVQGEDK